MATTETDNKGKPDNQEDGVLRRAVLFIHGMGMQRRFEEFATFVIGLLDCDALAKFRVNNQPLSSQLKETFQGGGYQGCTIFKKGPVRIGTNKDVEIHVMTFKDGDNYDSIARIGTPINSGEKKKLELDIHEVYWAPLTEGHINIFGILAWIMSTAPMLFRAAPKLSKGIRKSAWIHDAVRFILVIIAAIIVFWAGFWLVYTAYDVAKYDSVIINNMRLLADKSPAIISWLFKCIVDCHDKYDNFWLPFSVYKYFMTIFGLLLSCVLVHEIVSMNNFLPLDRGIKIFATVVIFLVWLFISGFEGLLIVLIVFDVILLIALLLQKYLVGYLGDVAIYVSDNEVRKDYQVRREIIRKTLDKINYLLSIKKDKPPSVKAAISDETDRDERGPYEDIVIVSHSLGSVIAYDALNKALFNDKTWKSEDARKRIKHLFTVGSPLEKIWFYFRDQSNRGNAIYQGILCDLKGSKDLLKDATSQFAELQWTNIWTLTDVISSALHRYGDGVDNQHDRNHNKRFPFLNHLNYWSSPFTMKLIGDWIFSPKKHE